MPQGALSSEPNPVMDATSCLAPAAADKSGDLDDREHGPADDLFPLEPPHAGDVEPSKPTEAKDNGPESTNEGEQSAADVEAKADAESLVADTKSKTPRAGAQPGAKRGGRRMPRSHVSLWRRLTGGRQGIHATGDLVEAEWMSSGWWYVGYVEGEARSATKTRKMYHVIFADGDEADVDGNDLKQLGPTGHTPGSAGTLSRHVPIADLGMGRLHRNVSPPTRELQVRGQTAYSKRPGSQATKNPDMGRPACSAAAMEALTGKGCNEGDVHSHLEEKTSTSRTPAVSKDPSRRDTELVESQRQRGLPAVWARTRPLPDSQEDAAKDGIGWWETGTQYAFQPRLAAEKATVERNDTASGRDSVPLSTRRVSSASAGGQEAFTARGNYNTGKHLKIVQPLEGNGARGQRIYFVDAPNAREA